ncbi:hypothetical protein MMC06_006037 [Schaereria dolodes]|nr:hypothetical protein [Schaereria dolodes]
MVGLHRAIRVAFVLSLCTIGIFHVVDAFPLSLSDKRTVPTSYGTITTTTNGSVMRATINHPPLNLYDAALAADLQSFVNSVSNNSDIKVVIFDSAIPEFFIAHYDIRLLSSAHPPPGPNDSEVGAMLFDTTQAISNSRVIFIAQISGRTHGAGNEIALQCDMRFAGPGALLGQLEVGTGVIPGAGGLQYLVSLIGRARAFEYILSSNDVDAVTAEAIGWVNKAYPSVAVLHDQVEALAHRIATFDSDALQATKERINVDIPSEQSIAGDSATFFALLKGQAAQTAVDRYLVASHNQTVNPFELGLDGDLVDLYM